jgi:hypothetical protein
VTVLITDSTVFVNFATVSRLALLRIVLRGRGRWTEAVAVETDRFAAQHPELALDKLSTWMSDPTEFPARALRDIQAYRRALSMPGEPPTKNLGEAEAIYALEHWPGVRGEVLVTDDRPAAHFARVRGLQVWDTGRLLGDGFQAGEIDCPDAWDLLKLMRTKGRGVYVPADHRAVC